METAAINQKELRLPPTTMDMSPREPGSVDKVEPTSPDKSQGILPTRTCNRCGARGHVPTEFSFKNAKCFGCGKIGHLRRVCESKQKAWQQQKPHSYTAVVTDKVTEEDAIKLYMLRAQSRVPPLKVEVMIDNHPLRMEIDTGAAYSLISQSTFESCGLQGN